MPNQTNLDPFVPEVLEDPYEVFAELRRRGVYQLPDTTMFIMTRFRDVEHVLMAPGAVFGPRSHRRAHPRYPGDSGDRGPGLAGRQRPQQGRPTRAHRLSECGQPALLRPERKKT